LEKLTHEDPETTYQNIRRAAEVHRQVRSYARRMIQPGMQMTDIANNIEDSVRALVEEEGLEAGIGFPTGLSLNHCAAHYTPNAGDTIGMPSITSFFSHVYAMNQCYNKAMS
jgi:methionyl aminopeptidase